jgi:hypothetical protein
MNQGLVTDAQGVVIGIQDSSPILQQTAVYQDANTTNTAFQVRNMQFKCNTSWRRKYSGGHALYDLYGRLVYDVKECPHFRKSLVMQDGTGQVVLSATFPHISRQCEFLIITARGEIRCVYHRHHQRRSKETLEIEGTTYGITKEKIPGKHFKKQYKWCNMATGESMMIVDHYSGDVSIYPACPEALEKAVVMITSYQCLIGDRNSSTSSTPASASAAPSMGTSSC